MNTDKLDEMAERAARKILGIVLPLRQITKLIRAALDEAGREDRAEIELLREDYASLQKARQEDGTIYQEQRAEIERLENVERVLDELAKENWATVLRRESEIERLRAEVENQGKAIKHWHGRAEAAEKASEEK